MLSILDQIKNFADQAHGGQLRKYSPERYIVHPARVMARLKEFTDDQTVLAAALLHDVLEDTTTTRDQIEEFLRPLFGDVDTQRTIKLVEELTDVYTKNNFPQWNRYRRKKKETERLEKVSPEAQTIKYADLMDNTSEIVQQDPEFAKRYLEEARKLLRRLKKGNSILRERAIEHVKKGFRDLESTTWPDGDRPTTLTPL
jgi:guanosine-3',5'-bis(diphosphate) 3'-pyrophosphohydrolase